MKRIDKHGRDVTDLPGLWSEEDLIVVDVSRAAALRDQVKKTWRPPLEFGGETPADVAQTSVMQTLAFVLGEQFLGSLTGNQQEAVHAGLKLFRRVLGE